MKTQLVVFGKLRHIVNLAEGEDRGVAERIVVVSSSALIVCAFLNVRLSPRPCRYHAVLLRPYSPVRVIPNVNPLMLLLLFSWHINEDHVFSMARTRSRRRPPSEAVLSLRELPLELQLHVASELSERTDRASICLALLPLGRAALRGLAEYREDILMSVALRLPRLVAAAKHTLLDERLLRFYVADRRATHDGCLWLNAAFAAAGFDLQVQAAGDSEMEWRLTAGPELGALLRSVRPSGIVVHYEGENGAERVVRVVHPSGM